MSECVNPLELNEGDLMTCVDGWADDRVRAHLSRCPHCQAQVNVYRHMAHLLQETLYRRDCPAPEQLALYQLNLLSPRERLVMSGHIRQCLSCQRELDELARVQDTPSLLERLRQAIGIIEAVLEPVSYVHAGQLRGPEEELVWQSFCAQGMQVNIGVQEGYDREWRMVRGQLLCRDPVLPVPADLLIWLMRDQDAWAAPVEGDGIFLFEEIEPGIYSVGFEWHGQPVLIREVTVI